MDVKEKLVELLDSHCDYAGHVDCKDDCTKCLADHLIANGVTVQDGKDTDVHTKWIPASEPPKKYRDEYGIPIPFLVCTSGQNYPFITYFYDGKHWGGKGQDVPVTHWMPLPELPKGE